MFYFENLRASSPNQKFTLIHPIKISKRLNGTNPSSNKEILNIDKPSILNFKSEVIIVNNPFSRIKKRFNSDDRDTDNLGFKNLGFST